MKSSPALDQLGLALALAQGEMSGASKSGKGNYGKYIKLSDVWDVARAALSKHGLSVVQSPSFDGARVVVTTTILHKSGQWIEDSLSVKPARDDAQAIGSAITYARKYSFGPMIGIVDQDDDDGNAAVGGPPPPPAQEILKKIALLEEENMALTRAMKVFDRRDEKHMTSFLRIMGEKKVTGDLDEIAERLDGYPIACLDLIIAESQKEKK